VSRCAGRAARRQDRRRAVRPILSKECFVTQGGLIRFEPSVFITAQLQNRCSLDAGQGIR